MLVAAVALGSATVADEQVPLLDRGLLTSSELAWLAAHPVIIEAEPRQPDMPPLSFLGEHGVYHGITEDYVALLARRLGVRVEVREFASTPEAVAGVASGQADFLGSIAVTPERARQMDLSEPYLVVNEVMVVRSGESRIGSPRDLAGRAIAIERGVARRQFLANSIPGIRFIDVTNAADALAAVRAGSADAYVGEALVVRYLLSRQGAKGLEVRDQVDIQPRFYVFAIRPGAFELVSMIDRVLASMSAEERRAIYAAWSPILPEPLRLRAVFAFVWPYLAGLAAFIAVVLAWNQTLRVQIRHRRRAEQAARDAQRAAETATRAKSEFLANMSHEIRTPMNGILGMAHLLAHGDIPPKHHEQAVKLQRSAKSLLGIINDILDFSKIEAGKLQIESAPFELTEVLEHWASLLGQQAAEKGVELLVAISPRVPGALIGDSLRLGQILLNLGSNAVKFTVRGSVTLTVEDLGRDSDGMTLRFSVRDTGIGMSESELARVFDPFSQADNSISRRFGGTGLGLPISAHLVSRMGGRLQARSQPGSGSEFYFESRWPLQTPAPSGAAPAPGSGATLPGAAQLTSPAVQASAAPLRGIHVLLVEDNEINRELATELLEAAGARVSVAEDGAAALRVLGGGSFDAILMDCHMPVMDGYEAARAIRAQTQWRDLPIIAMTASAMSGDRDKALAAGMNDQITKPLDVAAMLDTVRRWCAPATAGNAVGPSPPGADDMRSA